MPRELWQRLLGRPASEVAAYVAGTGPRARRTPPESASVGYPLTQPYQSLAYTAPDEPDGAATGVIVAPSVFIVA